MNRTLLSAITTMTKKETGRDWDKTLRNIQWTINSSSNNTTGKSPNELLFYFRPRDILQNKLLLVLQDTAELEPNPVAINRIEASEKIKEQKIKWKQRYDQQYKKPMLYNKDDLVVIENEPPSTGESRKLEPKYRGPYIVCAVLPNDRYVVEDVPGMQRSSRFYRSVYSSDKMKPWCQINPDVDDQVEADETRSFSSQDGRM